jgi:tRNA(fMet)-specific endonuclease VapC
MNYLLDTNACIALLNNRPSQVGIQLQKAWARGATIFLSCIVLHELFYGASKSVKRKANSEAIVRFLQETFEVLQFDLDAAQASGEIRALLEHKGQRIGEYDTLIAGQAFCRDLILVTANTREFERVENLKIEDWTK